MRFNGFNGFNGFSGLMQALALVLWGFAAGQWVIGVACAGLRLLAALLPGRLNLSESILKRAAGLTAVALGLEMVGVMLANGLPAGLLMAFGWMPIPLLPLILIAALNQEPLRWRHLSMRMQTASYLGADRVAELDAPYFVTTLLAASLLTKTSWWLYWAFAGLMLVWLLGRLKRRGARHVVSFVLAGGLAVGIGFFGSAFLRTTQQSLQDWFVDLISGVNQDPYQRQTSIGDLGRLKLSGRLVWRVEQAAPVHVPLLLRTGVYSRYANGAWLAKPAPFTPFPAPAALPDSKLRLNLHGASHEGAAMIPLPQFAGRVVAAGGQLSRNVYGVVQLTDAPPWLELSVSEDQNGRPLPPDEGDLALPAGFERIVQKIPEIASFRALSDREKLSSLNQWFADRFTYTLFLGDGQHGGRTLESFLTTDHAGHCEYFATATVLLLRAMNVPARYVTGFSVQEYNRLEKSFVVRQRHAHAWAEAFVDGRWIELDTTPATWADVEDAEASFWQPLADIWSYSLRKLAEWRRTLVAAVDHDVWVGWMILVACLFAGWRLRTHWRKNAPSTMRQKNKVSPQAISAEQNLFRELELEWSALGLARRPAEPPRSWLNRVAREGQSVLDPERVASARQLINRLYKSRYGAP